MQHNSLTTLGALPLTPYRVLHNLSHDEGELIPGWATKRTVFRSIDRTRYVVETSQLDAARKDLAELREQGWDIDVQRVDLTGTVRITMTAGAVVRAA